VLSQPPVDQPRAFQVAVQTLGRLADPDEFANILIKQTATAVVRLKDVARVELAALDYTTNSYLDRDPAVALGIFQLPGSNALATSKAVQATMDQLARTFPRSQVHDRLQSDRVHPAVGRCRRRDYRRGGRAGGAGSDPVPADLARCRHPIIAIPVSLVGTFFFMTMFGFSLNNLSLFGLVLAIGIVVDDAIVVVENVERNIAAGLSPADAARRSMDEVARP